MSTRKAAPGELELVRQFVNTLDVETGQDQLDDPRALSCWLDERGLTRAAEAAAVPSEADLAQARVLREAVREILLSHTERRAPPSSALATLDRTAQEARVCLRFDAGGVSDLRPEAAGVVGALGQLLAIVHRAAAEGTWDRLKACREHTCEWAFYDRTKNHSGTWCTMEVCGNRTKARAYRLRRAET